MWKGENTGATAPATLFAFFDPSARLRKFFVLMRNAALREGECRSYSLVTPSAFISPSVHLYKFYSAEV